MKNLRFCLLLLLFCNACKQSGKPIVSELFIDSLLVHYTPPMSARENEEELRFWSGRINPAMPGYLNESRYAGALAMQFRLFGEIDSLKKADSILQKVNRDFNYKEASVNLALSAHCITEHRFQQADSVLRVAKRLGLRPHESLTTSFDVDFELGRFTDAQIGLNAFASENDYGYFFRRSKMDHLNGSLDTAIHDMLRAAELADNNYFLKGIALSNAGDLYIHAGDLQEANKLFISCLRMNSADFHSLMGLGWIALVHDHNDKLAGKIFNWVQSKNKMPDALFRLAEIPAAGTDSSLPYRNAQAFVQKARDSSYGRMYNKYLIQLYTGILHDPARAESIARDELNNRTTPQTYAWYAWTLFANHKEGEAYKVFVQYVSGKPLEGLELYYMGRLLKGMNKGYDAREYFKAAYATRYDLGPSIGKELQAEL